MTPEEAIHETIDALRASADTIAALRGELATLRQQLEDAHVQRNNARRLAELAEDNMARWMTKHSEAEAALADLRQQVATLTQERDWLRADVTKIDNEREDVVDALEAMRAERDTLVQQWRPYLQHLPACDKWDRDFHGNGIDISERRQCTCGLATLTPPPAQPPQESATCPLCGRMRAWILARGYVCCYIDCAAHPAVTPPPAGETKASRGDF